MIRLLLKTDLKRLFATPQAWVLLALAQLVLAWAFFSELESFENIQHRLVAAESEIGLTALVVIPALLNTLNIIMLITPLLSMRMIAAERQSQRFDLLLASPIRLHQVLIARFAVLLVMLGSLWLVALLELGLLNLFTPLDTGRVLLVWGMGLMVLASYAAIGIWASSMTTHPLLAAMIAYAVLILLRIAGAVTGEAGLLDWFSITFHLTDAQLGLFNSTDLIYFILLIALFLTMAWIRLLVLRSRQYLWTARFTLAGLIVLLVISWPLFNELEYKQDVSSKQLNSLSPSTMELLDRLQGPLSFTAFVEDSTLMHKQVERLLNRFSSYRDDVVIRFVDPQAEPEISRTLGITRHGEILVRYGQAQQLVRRAREKDIANTLVQMVRRDHGWILNLQGHDELDLLDEGLYGGSRLSASLRARGYKIRNYALSELGAFPDNTDLVIIGASRNDLSEQEQIELNRYIDSGGSLLWLIEPETSAANVVAGLPKIALFPGVIVDATAAELKLASPANAVVSNYPEHAVTDGVSQFTLFPGASAFEVLEQGNWQQVLSLETGPKSWNETSEIKGELSPDPVLFEQKGPLQVAAFWEKQLAEKESGSPARQKLAIIGDSDFLRNASLGRGDNLSLTLNLFFWLTDNAAESTVPKRTASDLQITMTSVQRGLYGGFFLFGLPALLALGGFYTVWRSRRR